MAAILASAIGLAVYGIAVSLSVAAAVSLAALALVILALPVMAAWAMGYRQPKWSSWQVQAWSAIVLLAAGCVAAAGIYGAAQAAGASASGADKVIIGQLGAILAAAILQIDGILEAALAPWLSWKIFGSYRSKFPAMPQGLGPGRAAWDACATVANYDAASWNRPALEQFLATIGAAIAAGEYLNGPNWHPVAPAPPS